MAAAAPFFEPTTQSTFNGEDLQLQRRKLSQESQQRELLQTAFQRLARNLEVCRERLTVVDRPDVGKILEILRPLELVLQELSQASAQVRQIEGGRGSYEFLRHSVEAAQHECEELSNKLLHQSQVNDDMEQKLADSKAANQRLEEVLQKNEDELQRLKQQESFEKERLEDFRRRSKAEADAKEREARRLHEQALSERTSHHHQSMALLKSKLQKLQQGLPPAKLKLQSVREALQKPAIQSMQRELQNDLARMETKVSTNLASFLRIQGAKRVAAESTAKQLEMQISRESERQRQESLRAAQQQAIAAADAADFQARSTREIERLSSYLRATSSALTAERSLAIQEQSQKERLAEAAELQRKDANAAFERARQELENLKVSKATAEAELQRQQESWHLLRKQTRETGDNISMVTNGNEHLKEQLAEYKTRAQRVRQEEEANTKSARAEELLRRQHAHEADLVALKTRSTELEQEIQFKEVETMSQQEQLEEAGRTKQALQEEIATLKRQCTELGESRKAVEERAAEEEELWAQERLSLKTSLEEVRQQVERLEDTSQAATKQAQARAAELTKRRQLQHEHIESLKDDLHKAKAQLNEAKNLLIAENDALRDASTVLQGNPRHNGLEDLTRRSALQDKEALSRFLETKGMQGSDGHMPFPPMSRMGSALAHQDPSSQTSFRHAAVGDAALWREAQEQQRLALAHGRAQLDAALVETEQWKHLLDEKHHGSPPQHPQHGLAGTFGLGLATFYEPVTPDAMKNF